MSANVLKRKHFQIENGFSKQRSPRIQIEVKKANLFTQSNGEDTKEANLIKCQHQGKKKKLVPPNQILKGNGIVKPIDADQQTSASTCELLNHLPFPKLAIGIHFQEEIILEILSRLPVQSLLRFKCVSKIWEALISQPHFKMKHLSHDSNSRKLLVREWCRTQVGLAKFNFYSSSLSTFEDVQELNSPLSYDVDRYEIFSSFDGLILLRADAQLLLWNPFTRESALLPHSEFNVTYTSFGLGYDATCDGYKILKLNTCRPQSIEILTLKSGSWRKICNHPTAICPNSGYKMEIHPWRGEIVPMDPLVYVHGAFHWLGDLHLGDQYYAVSFNISNEVYGDVPLLDEMCMKETYMPNIGLSLLDGKLCFHITIHNFWLGSLKLWAMKDYGVKESWMVLYTIQLDGLILAKPQYRFPDGDVLLYGPGELPSKYGLPRSYVFQTSKGKFGFWPRCGTHEKGIVYRESLISPKLVI